MNSRDQEMMAPGQIIELDRKELAEIVGGRFGSDWSYTELGMWWSGGGATLLSLAIVGGPVAWIAVAGGLAFAGLGGGLIYADQNH